MTLLNNKGKLYTKLTVIILIMMVSTPNNEYNDNDIIVLSLLDLQRVWCDNEA